MRLLVTASILAALVAAEVPQSDIDNLKNQLNSVGLNAEVGDVNPQGVIEAQWGSQTLKTGDNIQAANVAQFPTISVNPVAGASAFNPTAAYSAALVDAGAKGNNTATLYWLINTIHINTSTTGGPYPLLYQNGTTITEYAAIPEPAAGGGAHGVAFLLFEQPADFAAPNGYQNTNTPPAAFNVQQYAKDAKLGPVVGINYFTVGADTAAGNSTAGNSTTNGNATAGGNATTSGAAGGQSGAASGASGSSGSGGVVASATSAAGSAAAAATSKAAGAQSIVLGGVASAVGLASVVAGALFTLF